MRGMTWGVAGVAAGLVLAAGYADPPGTRWADADRSIECELPAGWTLVSEGGGQATFAHGGGTPPRAFLNIVWEEEGEHADLASYAADVFRRLEVTPEVEAPPRRRRGREEEDADEGERICGCPILRASARTPSVPGLGVLLDLFVFVRGEGRYLYIMVTCRPTDRATYEPQLEEIVRGLRLREGESAPAPEEAR